MKITSPEVLAFTSGLQLPMDDDRSYQLEPQALEGRIVGQELTLGPNRTSSKVPDIHAQHSPLI